MTVTNSSIEDKMLAYAASHSPAEISRLLGGVVTPEEVASRTVRLLHDRDWLSLAQKRQLAYIEMQEIVASFRDWARDGSKDAAEIVLRGTQQIMKFLDKDQASLSEMQVTITAAYAARMGEAISLALDALLSLLRTKGLEISDEEMVEALKVVMPIAFNEIDKSVERL